MKNTKFHERKKVYGEEGGVTWPDCKVLAELGLSVPGVKFLGMLKIIMHSKHYDSFAPLVGSPAFFLLASLTHRIASRKYGHMKTTIDLPDAIFEQTKIAAARRRTTIKNLVIEGLETILRQEAKPAPPADALARLRQGYHLGGKPLGREESHGR